MNCFQRMIIGNKEPNNRDNFIWNMIGSAIFAASSMFLSLFMIHILGEDIGGMFSIGITVSQMMAFIVYYETRTYQVTDITDKYSFGEYKATKLMLCAVMIIVCIIYVAFTENGFGPKAQVILLMCVYRMIDGYSDLYESTFQADGRLYLTGKSQAYRTLLSSLVIVAISVITGNITLAIILGIISAVIGLYLFDILIMKTFRSIRAEFKADKMIGILKDCFAMFIGAFLWTYILSAGRIAINANMTTNFQSYYQTLFMPISVINLCATFVMKPALPFLSEKFGNSDIKGFFGQCTKIVILIVSFTVFCMIAAWLLGIPVLQLLSGCNLSEYRGTLVFLMLAGGVNSLAYFMYYILSIMRKRAGIFTGYVTASIIALILSDRMVKSNGIQGAATSFFIVVTMLLIIFLIFIVIGILDQRKR